MDTAVRVKGYFSAIRRQHIVIKSYLALAFVTLNITQIAKSLLQKATLQSTGIFNSLVLLSTGSYASNRGYRGVSEVLLGVWLVTDAPAATFLFLI